MDKRWSASLRHPSGEGSPLGSNGWLRAKEVSLWSGGWPHGLAAASQGTLTVLTRRPVRRVVARPGGEVAGRCVRHVDYHLACRVNVWGVGVTKSGRPWPCRTATPRLLLGPSSAPPRPRFGRSSGSSSAAPLGPPPRSYVRLSPGVHQPNQCQVCRPGKQGVAREVREARVAREAREARVASVRRHAARQRPHLNEQESPW